MFINKNTIFFNIFIYYFMYLYVIYLFNLWFSIHFIEKKIIFYINNGRKYKFCIYILKQNIN